MGRFIYEDTVRTEFEDRALAHLQIVIGNKLRRNEPFFFTWKDESKVVAGRTTVWLHARASLVFQSYGSRSPQMNMHWLNALMYTANSSTGLYLVPEPQGPVAEIGPDAAV